MENEMMQLQVNRELYKLKAQECWEILTHLYDWHDVPESKLQFSINNVLITSFSFGGSEMEFMRATFMSLNAYYRNKLAQTEAAIKISKHLDKDRATDPIRPA